MDNQYTHDGKRLVLSIARELILELFKGKSNVRKRDIDNKVEEVHRNRGGLEHIKKTHPVTDALDSLKKNGQANNLKRGYWNIFAEESKGNDDKGCVYVYYYPTYKEQAKSKGEDRWPCKIGSHASLDPKSRIAEQVTGMPEAPQTEIVMYTENPQHIERIIHSILKLKERNRHIQDAPDSEWFLISPDIAKRVVKEFENFLNRINI